MGTANMRRSERRRAVAIAGSVFWSGVCEFCRGRHTVTQGHLAACNSKGNFSFVTDKQAMLDALQRLPENASFEEIAEELRIMAAFGAGEPMWVLAAQRRTG